MRYFLISLFTTLASIVSAADLVSTPLTEDRILPAMQRALGDTVAQIEIVEMSRFPAPNGEVEFFLKDLTPPATSATSTRWRGWIHEGDQKTFAIWAIVKIKSECKRVVATETLEIGKPILPSQLREETYMGFPFGKDAFVSIDDVSGRAPLRTLRTGSAVRLDATVEPLVVANGAELIAEFRSGRIRVSAPVVALGSGRLGEVISVRNPTSKKIFSAKIDAPGVVIVETGQ